MPATITINPYLTTVGNAGLFNVQSTGFRQGTAYPDPSTIYRLRGCLLAQSETLPMWGGVGVYMDVPGGAGNPNYSLGPICGRAASLTDATKPLAGFSVFDQDYAMITSPQSPVPLIGSSGRVHVYPLGSLARIAVACDPDLVDLRGGAIGANVSWDFVNQQLIPYISGTVASGTYTSDATISSGTYNSTTGAVVLTIAGNHGLLPGDQFSISALTGTGAFASLDGSWTAAAGTASATLNFTAPTGLGTTTITGGTLGTGSVSLVTTANYNIAPGDPFILSSMSGATALNGQWTAAQGTTGTTVRFLVPTGLSLSISTGNIASGGVLPVKVLDIQATNCETVVYNATTGFATWNYNGSAAIIQI